MSNYVKNECVIAGVGNDKVHVIPYFTPRVHQQPEAVTERRLLYCGRLSQIKGVHTMIGALRPLFDKYENLKLEIIGDGPFRQQLTDLVREMSLQDRIKFHGWLGRNEVDRALTDSYLVLFPSIYPEAFGISGIEAMMHGKPVVAFDVGGVSTWLKDGVSGYLIPEKDVAQMSSRVEELINDEQLAAKMGGAGREIALKDFSPEVHISKLKQVYEAAIDV
jgi:glycosyltransferase involved in cell wall biosynthesis